MQCHRLALGSSGCHRPRLVDLHSRLLLQIGLSLPPTKESHSTFKEPTKESTAISAISSILVINIDFNIRQIKEKNKHEEKPPFFDFSSLKSRTIQTIMVSTASIAAGIYTPLIYLVSQFSWYRWNTLSLYIYIFFRVKTGLRSRKNPRARFFHVAPGVHRTCLDIRLRSCRSSNCPRTRRMQNRTSIPVSSINNLLIV